MIKAIKITAATSNVKLPDGRTLQSGETANLSLEHYLRIKKEHIGTLVNITSVITAAVAEFDTDLTTDTAAVPTGYELGQVVAGPGGMPGTTDLYQLVKVVDAVAVTAGMLLTWADEAAREATPDRAGGSAATGLPIAGVAVAAITAGQYGWIQIAGHVPALDVAAGTAAGAMVGPSATVDGEAATSAATKELLTTTAEATGQCEAVFTVDKDIYKKNFGQDRLHVI